MGQILNIHPESYVSWGSVVVKALRYKSEGPGVFFLCVLGLTQPLKMSTRLILGVKVADNLPSSCADVKKSGSLYLLEPSGSVQACNGTAFTFHSTTNILAPPLPQLISPNLPYRMKAVVVLMHKEGLKVKLGASRPQVWLRNFKNRKVEHHKNAIP
jgi:hypothetical protein